MDIQTIRYNLENLATPKTRDFAKKLIVTRYPILGIKNPDLRDFAKKLVKSGDESAVFETTPESYEEVLLRAFCIGLKKVDTETLLSEIDDYIPLIDNWSSCDCFVASLKQFKKNPLELFSRYESFKYVGTEFERRFLAVILLDFGLSEDYIDYSLKTFQQIRCGEYFVDMAIAWGFATALAKFYDKTLPIIESKTLPYFVHNKSIQKAIESYRITQEQKNYLRTLKLEKAK